MVELVQIPPPFRGGIAPPPGTDANIGGGAMSALSKFQDELSHFPSAGGGVHGHVMRLANLATLSGMNPTLAAERIRSAMSRPPSPGNEVESALRKAGATCGTLTPGTRHRTRAEREREQRQREALRKAESQAAVETVLRLTQGRTLTFEELAAQSPVHVGDPRDPDQQRLNASALLERLHPDPEAILFCGPRWGGREFLATRSEWQERFQTHMPPPFWICNSLSGQGHPAASGTISHRCDKSILRPLTALFEVDNPGIGLDVQTALAAVLVRSGWNLRAAIWSGGKSVHLLVGADCESLEEWDQRVRGELFPTWQKMGADPQCQNPARLTRLPGHWRDGSRDRVQSLLWLA